MRKDNDKLSSLTSKGSNEPALRKEIEKLERSLQAYENADLRSTEKDTTIKKLIFANKTLREDLQQEIDRFNLLQDKYKELLIKYNVISKENQRNQKNLFTMGTGAQL